MSFAAPAGCWRDGVLVGYTGRVIHVDGHDFVGALDDAALAQYRIGEDEVRRWAEQSPQRLGEIMDEALAGAGLHHACGRETYARTLLRLAAESGFALFAAASADTGAHLATIGGVAVAVPCIGTHPLASARRWEECYWLTLVFRDDAARDALLEPAASRWEVDDAGASARMQTLLSLDGAGSSGIVSLGASRAPAVGELEPLLAARLAADQGEREAALLGVVGELQRHHERWAQTPSDPRGLLALGPLGVAALALDRDAALPVASPYLPAYLIRHR